MVRRARHADLIDAALLLGAVLGLGQSQDLSDFASAMRQAAGLLAIDTAPGMQATTPSTTIACAARTSASGLTAAIQDAAGARLHADAPCATAFPSRSTTSAGTLRGDLADTSAASGSALTDRNTAPQSRELVLPVLTHDLAPLAKTV